MSNPGRVNTLLNPPGISPSTLVIGFEAADGEVDVISCGHRAGPLGCTVSVREPISNIKCHRRHWPLLGYRANAERQVEVGVQFCSEAYEVFHSAGFCLFPFI